MKHYLITTSIKETWPHGERAVALGAWCKCATSASVRSQLKITTAPYHWDDRTKLKSDYALLKTQYEKLLGELAEKLNSIHGVDFSQRYWRILIGPWLGSFVQILFDRWSVINSAIEDLECAEVHILNTKSELLVPTDMNDFYAKSVSDVWNEGVFAEILNHTPKVITHKLALTASCQANSQKSRWSMLRNWFVGLIKWFLNVFAKSKTKSDEVFIFQSYMPKEAEIRLQRNLGQLTKIWRYVAAPQISVDWSKRDWELTDDVCSTFGSFEKLLLKLIPRHMPTIYLEGFDELRHVCKKVSWPSKPKIIFTSNAFNSDDVFKAWAAEKVVNGTPLIIGQHGGNYGMALWNYMEEHQTSISDLFLSWGWEKQSEPKIVPVCNLKTIDQKQEFDPDGGALMVELAIPRYSCQMYSAPVAGQWLDYFGEQIRFVKTLPDIIRHDLKVRLYSDYGWNEKDEWKKRFPDVDLDPGNRPISDLIKGSRIVISTYNATTYLETLSYNVPTLIFWNTKYWELNKQGQDAINVLKEAGIFHDSPEAAAKKLTEIWGDVLGWWNSSECQTARIHFCSKYSRHPEDALTQIERAFRTFL